MESPPESCAKEDARHEVVNMPAADLDIAQRSGAPADRVRDSGCDGPNVAPKERNTFKGRLAASPGASIAHRFAGGRGRCDHRRAGGGAGTARINGATTLARRGRRWRQGRAERADSSPKPSRVSRRECASSTSETGRRTRRDRGGGGHPATAHGATLGAVPRRGADRGDTSSTNARTTTYRGRYPTRRTRSHVAANDTAVLRYRRRSLARRGASDSGRACAVQVLERELEHALSRLLRQEVPAPLILSTCRLRLGCGSRMSRIGLFSPTSRSSGP